MCLPDSDKSTIVFSLIALIFDIWIPESESIGTNKHTKTRKCFKLLQHDKYGLDTEYGLASLATKTPKYELPRKLKN